MTQTCSNYRRPLVNQIKIDTFGEVQEGSCCVLNCRMYERYWATKGEVNLTSDTCNTRSLTTMWLLPTFLHVPHRILWVLMIFLSFSQARQFSRSPSELEHLLVKLTGRRSFWHSWKQTVALLAPSFTDSGRWGNVQDWASQSTAGLSAVTVWSQSKLCQQQNNNHREQHNMRFCRKFFTYTPPL